MHDNETSGLVIVLLGVMIEECASIEQPGWLSLREALWPDCAREEHLWEMSSFLANPARYAQLVAPLWLQ